MATKTIMETDGSVDFSKQSDIWLQERLNGVIQSIKASDNSHPDDIATFKQIADEMKKRGQL